MPEPTFPVKTLDEALPFLRRPFTPQAVKWKIQTCWGGTDPGAIIVGYIDARLVIERLNLVVGGNWYGTPDPRGEGTWYALTVFGVTRVDVGVGQGPQKVKAGASDALKRAAVHFGVGVSLYAIPTMTLKLATPGVLKTTRDDKPPQKRSFAMKEKGRVDVRKAYEIWLREFGVAQFHDPIDHGDQFNSLGDVDDPALADELATEDDSDVPWSEGALCQEASESLGPCVRPLGHTDDHANADGVAWPEWIPTDERRRIDKARVVELRREAKRLASSGDLEGAERLESDAGFLEAGMA